MELEALLLDKYFNTKKNVVTRLHPLWYTFGNKIRYVLLKYCLLRFCHKAIDVVQINYINIHVRWLLVCINSRVLAVGASWILRVWFNLRQKSSSYFCAVIFEILVFLLETLADWTHNICEHLHQAHASWCIVISHMTCILTLLIWTTLMTATVYMYIYVFSQMFLVFACWRF